MVFFTCSSFRTNVTLHLLRSAGVCYILCKVRITQNQNISEKKFQKKFSDHFSFFRITQKIGSWHENNSSRFGNTYNCRFLTSITITLHTYYLHYLVNIIRICFVSHRPPPQKLIMHYLFYSPSLI